MSKKTLCFSEGTNNIYWAATNAKGETVGSKENVTSAFWSTLVGMAEAEGHYEGEGGMSFEVKDQNGLEFEVTVMPKTPRPTPKEATA